MWLFRGSPIRGSRESLFRSAVSPHFIIRGTYTLMFTHIKFCHWLKISTEALIRYFEQTYQRAKSTEIAAKNGVHKDENGTFITNSFPYIITALCILSSRRLLSKWEIHKDVYVSHFVYERLYSYWLISSSAAALSPDALKFNTYLLSKVRLARLRVYESIENLDEAQWYQMSIGSKDTVTCWPERLPK